MKTPHFKSCKKNSFKDLKTGIIVFFITISFSLSLQAQEDYFYRCLDYFKEGDAEKTIECINDYLKTNQKKVDALFIRALCYEHLGEYQWAFSDINNAIKYHNKKAFYKKDHLYAQRGKFYASLDNNEDALKDFATALKINPKNTDVIWDRANLYYNMENYAASDEDWKQILKLNKLNINAQVGLCRNMIARGQLDEAIKELDRLEKLDSKNPVIFQYRNDAHSKKENYRKAIDDLINWVFYDGGDDFKENMLSNYAEHEFIYALAKVSEKIIKDEDKKISWLYLRINLYENNDMYQEAIEDYNTIETLLNSPDIYIFYGRGRNYSRLGEYDKAITEFDNGIELQEHKALFSSRASAKSLKGDFKSAISDYTKAIELDPMNSFAYFMRGRTKEYEKDFQGALKDYTTSIELDKEFENVYYSRGQLYTVYLNQPQLAEKDFNTVLELETETDISKGGNRRTYALFYLGRIDDAIAHQNVILEKHPTKENYYDAACLYSLMNNLTESIKHLRLSFEKGYRDFVHIENDTDMDNIRNTNEFIELVEEWKRKAAELSAEANQTVNSEPLQTQIYTVKTKELRSGVYEIPCTVNDLPLKFIFDTGASDITISSLEAAFMLKNNYLNEYDFKDRRNYMTASGDIVEGTKIRLRKINIGDLELKNIEASVVHNQKAPLLFGQSALGKFVKITIDNKNNEIIFEK